MKFLLPILVCIVGLSSCHRGTDVPDVREQVIQKLKQLKENHDTTCKLKSVTNLGWDKLYIIPPYWTQRAINKDLLPYEEQIIETGIELREDINILYFLKKGQLVAKAEIERNIIDFPEIKKFDETDHLRPFYSSQTIRWDTMRRNYEFINIK